MKAWCVWASLELSARCVCVCVCALPLRTVHVRLVCTQMKVWAELICDVFVLRLWDGPQSRQLVGPRLVQHTLCLR